MHSFCFKLDLLQMKTNVASTAKVSHPFVNNITVNISEITLYPKQLFSGYG